MAGAIIGAVATAVGLIGPLIGPAIQTAEQLLGHSSDTGAKRGDQKMDLTTSILVAALTVLANKGVIASAPIVDPNLKVGLTGAVQQAVDALKAQGQLNAPASSTGAPGSVVTSTTTPTGKLQFTITLG